MLIDSLNESLLVRKAKTFWNITGFHYMQKICVCRDSGWHILPHPPTTFLKCHNHCFGKLSLFIISLLHGFLFFVLSFFPSLSISKTYCPNIFSCQFSAKASQLLQLPVLRNAVGLCTCSPAYKKKIIQIACNSRSAATFLWKDRTPTL